MALTKGIHLGQYEIETKIGGGGMGDVYRARDLKLNRTIAIKVLREASIASPERRARFDREAQSIAALNHPNIVTIHSVEESDGVLFLTMEYVDGKPLSDLIPRGGLPLARFLNVSIPLADAISAAHQKGIAHRDLKPANVMVTTDGRVKVLDFGLAKLVEAAPVEAAATGLPTAPVTGEGRIVGTVAYMSPEQAEAKPVDHRSDIFSLGVMLYELATGERPFRGDTSISVISSIVKDSPRAITELNQTQPRDLAQIVRRCLVKDPSRRYQTAVDLRNELEEVKQLLESGELARGSLPSASSAHRTLKRTWWLLAGSSVGVLLLVLLALRLRSIAVTAPTLANPVLIAGSVAIERRPAWSPDGHMLAYQSDQGGKQDIWIAQVSGGQAINRTADFRGDSQLPRWSPDGRQIAFYSDQDGAGTYLMSALAGSARKVAAMPNLTGGIPAAWSPDGSELAYPFFDSASGIGLERLDVQNATKRKGPLPGDAGRLDVTWSPDGRFVAYVDQAGGYTSQVTRVRVLSLSDGRAHAITDGRTEEWNPSWSPDSRTIYFSSNRGGTRDLWQQRLDGDGAPVGLPERVTTAVDVLEAALSPDGKRVAYAKGRKVANVWRVPVLGERAATWADAQQITVDQAHIEFFDISPDGERLAVQSDRSGNPDIWVLPAPGGEMQQITSDPTPDWAPQWSPDGREIAYYAFRSGQREIWIAPVGGGPARQLTHAGRALHEKWSPDGATVFYVGVGGLYSIPAAGGEPRKVGGDPPVRTSPDAGARAMSPDGRWFAANNEKGIWRVALAGGDPILITKMQGRFAKWFPDGHSIVFVYGANLWQATVDGKPARPLTNFVGRRGYLENDPATDGRYVYFSWREDISDIWVMDVVSPGRR